MHTPSAFWLVLLLALGSLWARPLAAQQPSDPAPRPPAEPPASPTPADKNRVEVTGRRDATEQRRLSTAAKIIVSREEIEQFGDLSLGDVLKRLPSVTIGGRPGRGGQIRMRGMGNGYTQILVDGDRMPPGFSIDQISPDQIERIEILRAPTAETGARAIAGTINIVLREPLRQRGGDLRLGLSRERHGLRPNASWSRSDVLGETGTWNVNLSASAVDQTTFNRSDTVTTDLGSGQVTLNPHRESRQDSRRNAANLNGRLQWQLGAGDMLSIQPFVALSQGRTQTTGQLTQTVGTAPYDDSQSAGHSRSANARLALQLRKRLDQGTRVELRGQVGGFRSTSDSLLVQTSRAGATPMLTQRSDTSISDRSWNLNGKVSHTLFDKHSLVAGLEGEGVRRLETGLQRAEASNASVSGQPTAVDVDGDLQASSQRLAAYVQDEWEPAPTVSAYAGLRWETIRTRSTSNTSAVNAANPVSNTGSVLTPLAHAVWRFNAPARDQLRLSLTRSYRPPALGNLVALPRFNSTDPVPGANTPITADRSGNPGLRPELARGLDLALEHYLPGGGVFSASAFSRQINDLIRNVTALESVSWANVPRWVSRPRNIGTANTQGVELDAKFRLEELVDNAPALALRGNLGVYRSSVSGIAGPDNRIDQQPKLSLNLGGDHRLRGWPLLLGANLAWVPGYAVQQTEQQRAEIDTTRVLDTFVLWTVDPGTKLRISLSNLVPRRYVTRNSIVAGGVQQLATSKGPTERVLGLRLELKL
jgi:iron complex outermembrane receptor protein